MKISNKMIIFFSWFLVIVGFTPLFLLGAGLLNESFYDIIFGYWVMGIVGLLVNTVNYHAIGGEKNEHVR